MPEDAPPQKRARIVPAFNLEHLTHRVAACGFTVGLGAVAAALGQDGVLPWASALAGLAGNVLATDLSTSLANRPDSATEILQNDDLSRAVCDAMAMVVRRAAGEENRDDRRYLERLADDVYGCWKVTEKAASEEQRQRIDNLSDLRFPQLFGIKAKAFGHAGVLDGDPAKDKAAWQVLLTELARARGDTRYLDTFLAPETFTRVAGRLHTEFPQALREVLKHDAATGGRAYPGMQLMLLGEILAAGREMLKTGGKQHKEIVKALEQMRRAASRQAETLLETMGAAERARNAQAIKHFNDLDARFGALSTQLIAEFDRVVAEVQSSEGRIIQAIEVATQRRRELAVDRQRVEARRHNLPTPLTPFVGRAAEVAEGYALLHRPDVRLLTLTGFGGMGKSRVALRLAERCVAEDRTDAEDPLTFPDGVWWVVLEEVDKTGDDLLRRIAGALRLPPQPGVTVGEQVDAYLREGRLLLVLDNVEQVGEAPKVVRNLLANAPGLKCLVTSRRTLGLRAETVIALDGLSHADAEQLFLECARASRGDFARSEENTRDIADLCRRLENIPLALELAAARVVVLTPRQMLGRLPKRFEFLKRQRGASDAPNRQQTLRDTITWSHDLLRAEDEREGTNRCALFARLSVFAGDFSLEEAEAVCPDDDCDDVFEGLEALCGHSLLRAKHDARKQASRFMLLDSLREYAAEQLRETGDGGAGAHCRHAEHFLREAEKRLPLLRTPNEAAALRDLDEQSDEMRAAIAWAGGAGSEHGGLRARLALAVGVTLHRRGYQHEAIASIEDGLEAARPLCEADPGLCARLHLERAGLHLDHDETAEARRRAQEAVKFFQQMGDVQGQAQAENLLGLAAMAERAFAEARERFARALAQFERAGNATYAAILHNNLGLLEHRDEAGDKEAARRHYEEALRSQGALSDRRGIANTLNNLGILAYHRGDLDEAWGRYAEALGYERELSHLFGVASTLFNLGEVAEARGERERACRLFAASEHLFQKVNSPHAASTADLLARAAADRERPEEALAALRQEITNKPLNDLIAWALASAV